MLRIVYVCVCARILLRVLVSGGLMMVKSIMRDSINTLAPIHMFVPCYESGILLKNVSIVRADLVWLPLDLLECLGRFALMCLRCATAPIGRLPGGGGGWFRALCSACWSSGMANAQLSQM
jgi:hypothetical protein